MTVILLQVSRIKPRLWETKSIEVPISLLRVLIRLIIPASTVTSRAVVGSSKRRRLGLDNNAIAITILCC